MLDVKSRQLIVGLTAQLCKTSKNITDIETLITNLLTSTVHESGRLVVSSGNTGNIADGFRSFTISNVGTTSALVDGQDFPAGWSETYSVENANDVLDGMTYDTQATTLIINTVL